MPKTHVYKMMPSPVGQLKLVASDTGLAAILWENDDPKRVRLDIVGEDPSHPVLVEKLPDLREVGQDVLACPHGPFSGRPVTVPHVSTLSHGNHACRLFHDNTDNPSAAGRA